MLDFLGRHPVLAVSLSEGEGEAAGITYRIRGAGPPLILMPLSLAPSARRESPHSGCAP